MTDSECKKQLDDALKHNQQLRTTIDRVVRLNSAQALELHKLNRAIMKKNRRIERMKRKQTEE